MKPPRVSVIIPTWNRESTLLRAIRSAQEQTVPVHEILVCDDGSTDNSEALVRTIPDHRVRWIAGKPSHGRPAVPRNRGLKVATGDWIAFLDSDDEWLPTKLEKQFSLLAPHNGLASSTNGYLRTPSSENMLYAKKTKSRIYFRDLTKSNLIMCSSALVHTSIIVRAGLFPEAPQVVEDYAYWLRVAAQTDFLMVEEPLMYYQVSTGHFEVYGLGEAKVRRYILEDFLSWAKDNPHGAPFHAWRARTELYIRGPVRRTLRYLKNRMVV